jgi:2-amino-4-hydroxy-6-hydroxymethyldihydropteridine diphosphokinase
MARIYISLGTNINRDHYVKCGIEALTATFGQLTLSSLYESAPVGFKGDAFYNMVIAADTECSVQEVAQQLRAIEFNNGRPENAQKYSSRTLDLDLLLYDDLVIDQPVQLPRQEITENAFVLWPLSEIAGQIIHPLLSVSYEQLWQQFGADTQQIVKLPCK